MTVAATLSILEMSQDAVWRGRVPSARLCPNLRHHRAPGKGGALGPLQNVRRCTPGAPARRVICRVDDCPDRPLILGLCACHAALAHTAQRPKCAVRCGRAAFMGDRCHMHTRARYRHFLAPRTEEQVEEELVGPRLLRPLLRWRERRWHYGRCGQVLAPLYRPNQRTAFSRRSSPSSGGAVPHLWWPSRCRHPGTTPAFADRRSPAPTCRGRSPRRQQRHASTRRLQRRQGESSRGKAPAKTGACGQAPRRLSTTAEN
jgi:hypothetical protein